MASIFTKIMRGEIPGQIVHDDTLCAAFRDIEAQAPSHILIVPKKEIPSLDKATSEDQALLGHLLLVAQKVVRQEGIAESGFRLVINTNKHGGQSVSHLHIHLLGGRQLEWPPG